MVFQYAKLTDAQFQKFRELIFQQAGIHLKPEKKELLNTRLCKRLRACGIDSFRKYYDLVVNDKSGNELIHLIDCVSTNFTGFFREKPHFDYLRSTILPQFVAEHEGRREIVLWSAACSSGEEPYTLAMVMEEYRRLKPALRYRIMATDISTRVLVQAERGIYSQDRLEKLPAELLRRYFQKGTGQSAGFVKVKEQLKHRISFHRFNLMHNFPWREEMHVIFCRNVMIYFNRSTQEELVRKFHQCLASGGYLFIGHSESLASFRHEFKQVASTAYFKE
jgi:chemotaxis protein methyltransferase CheR